MVSGRSHTTSEKNEQKKSKIIKKSTSKFSTVSQENPRPQEDLGEERPRASSQLQQKEPTGVAGERGGSDGLGGTGERERGRAASSENCNERVRFPGAGSRGEGRASECERSPAQSRLARDISPPPWPAEGGREGKGRWRKGREEGRKNGKEGWRERKEGNRKKGEERRMNG